LYPLGYGGGGRGMAASPAVSIAGALRSAAMEFSVMFAGTAGSVPSARRGLPALLVRRSAELMRSMRRVYGKLGFSLEVVELEAGESVRRDTLEIHAVNVRHRVLAYGYVLVEDPRPGRFDADLATALGVTPGPDFGRLQRGEAVAGVHPEQVIGEQRPGRKVVVSGDTAPCETLAIAAHRADLLVHEATFGEEERDRARLTGHSTAAQAAQIAADAEVKLLALTHISARYGGSELRDEARAVFAACELPRDFDTIEIPLADRGTPTLVRVGEVPRAAI